MLDTEFTIEQGRLWMLQTRVGKRTGAAALRLAVAMTPDPAIQLTPQEAVLRISGEQLDQVLHPTFESGGTALTRGLAASPGAGVGRVYFRADDAVDAYNRGEDVVLVRTETSPEDVHGMQVSEGHPDLAGRARLPRRRGRPRLGHPRGGRCRPGRDR